MTPLPTIRRRLLRRMALHHISDVNQYIKLLQADPEELRGLFQDVLIHVTRFFREPESFTALTEHVFPKLIEGHMVSDVRRGEDSRHLRQGTCS